MSVKHMAWVWEHSRAEGGTLLVALALADSVNYLGDGDVCYPRQDKIAERVRLSERQVVRCIAELVELGEIAKRRTQNGNRYTFLLVHETPRVPEHPAGSCADPTCCRNDTDGVTTSVSQDPTLMSEPVSDTGVGSLVEPEVETERETEKSAGEQQAFLPDPVREVWDHYMQAFPRSRRSLDSARRTCIKRALKVRTVDECKRAIDYIAQSPHHNGQNENQTKYDDIKYALGLPGESPDVRIDKWLGRSQRAKAEGNSMRSVLETIPSDLRETVARDMRQVEQMYANPDHRTHQTAGKSAEAALLRFKRKIRPIIENDRVVGWVREEA